MWLTEHLIFAVMPVPDRDLLAVTVHKSRIVLCTEEVCNTVAMPLLGFCHGNDAMHAAGKTLSGEEAQTVPNVDDGGLRLGLDEMAFFILWR